MASFEALHDRLAALQETTGQLKELIDRLATLKFEPGLVPLTSSISSIAAAGKGGGGDGDDDGSDNVAAELSAEISQILREEDEDLELLQEEIIDLRPGRPGSDIEHAKARLKEGAQRLEQDLKRCRTSFRAAQIAARRSMESAQKLERELLIASYVSNASAVLQRQQDQQDGNDNGNDDGNDDGNNSQNHQQQQQQVQHQVLFTARDRRRWREKNETGTYHNRDVVTAGSDVTEALRRTHALITGEVSKSAFAAQTLAESSAALRELQQTYEGVDGLLRRSRALLGTLLTSQKSDTWYLRTTMYMLLSTLAWLVFRRFLYGPLWWVLWLPLRTSLLAGRALTSTALGAARGGGGGDGQPQAASSASIKIRGIETTAVPTIRLGDEKDSAAAVDPDSMLDKVARNIDEAEDVARAEAENQTSNHGGDVEDGRDEPNPMKRMWEEETGEESNERVDCQRQQPQIVRDEL
ncbi:hypothetical protein B0T26DRAFT_631071 [Lasiosphaeria miniovina]|uniref:Sec20 C-terminal domain-containing protein n=1 Tax=Lasiosphaeria miniovina TaxID=1954250 RepID=A0AA40BGY1_9PEZI|nr:uncharacterized protein B0T26DRAFT_631071 [Lasiosphaeria miniovina]KAK0734040.1 hypothetical protein B0T26DRAFT_631071 [Lasiosphaeria miniovina]